MDPNDFTVLTESIEINFCIWITERE